MKLAQSLSEENLDQDEHRSLLFPSSYGPITFEDVRYLRVYSFGSGQISKTKTRSIKTRPSSERFYSISSQPIVFLISILHFWVIRIATSCEAIDSSLNLVPLKGLPIYSDIEVLSGNF